ncbi:MAG: hypothetical protein DM484_02900 [Candidatus Methylumidiphilus alinenensis]|uniref:Uncharacterized protein n=1 Tax=Candidatus Methylumidiphilus alinenensis TaxID=2202197 RepID=A0A2W4RSP7_9GAMM|nr:MAG: hypothetical protein DM484_02900 [Candidatus Methylumidiphilus alinenensis]
MAKFASINKATVALAKLKIFIVASMTPMHQTTQFGLLGFLYRKRIPTASKTGMLLCKPFKKCSAIYLLQIAKFGIEHTILDLHILI